MSGCAVTNFMRVRREPRESNHFLSRCFNQFFQPQTSPLLVASSWAFRLKPFYGFKGSFHFMLFNSLPPCPPHPFNSSGGQPPPTCALGHSGTRDPGHLPPPLLLLPRGGRCLGTSGHSKMTKVPHRQAGHCTHGAWGMGVSGDPGRCRPPAARDSLLTPTAPAPLLLGWLLEAPLGDPGVG